MLARVDRAQLIRTLIEGNLSSCLVRRPRVPSDTVVGRNPEILDPRDGKDPGPKNVVPPAYGRAVLDDLFPLVCPGCGRPGAPVCEACSGLLRPPPPGPPPRGVD